MGRATRTHSTSVFDEGYALHILLTGMFGPGVLRPFRLFASERRRNASLYAYTDADQTELQSTANLVATPDCLDALDPNRIRSKEMHTEFTAGQRLGFDLRVRPVGDSEPQYTIKSPVRPLQKVLRSMHFSSMPFVIFPMDGQTKLSMHRQQERRERRSIRNGSPNVLMVPQ